MIKFYEELYGKKIPVGRATEVLDAWLREHLALTDDLEVIINTDYCLQFVPAFEMLVPHVASIVGIRGIDAEIIRVYLEVEIGKWNSEEWEEVLRKEHLPQLLTDFFGIVDPEEDLVIPYTGMYIPRFLERKKAKISYPPCTCRGCGSPNCLVRRRRR